MSDKTIRLGLMAPMTGLVNMYGKEISWAGQVACQEINEQGGVLGKKLELITLDDGSLPETAVPAANRLIDEYQCVAIIGNLLSNSRISVANNVAEPRRVPYLNFSFYEGSIFNRYFFNFAALPNQQIDKMIPYMAEKYGQKMFFAGSNYEWPRGSIDAAINALKLYGGEVVGEEYLPIGSTEIEQLLDQVSKSGADVFVPYFAGSDQTNLLTRFYELGLKDKMKVVMGHYDEAMVQRLPAHVREGFYSSNTYFMGLETNENKNYLARLKQLPDVTGIWPEGDGLLTNFGEGTYVCVHAFANAINQAGSADREAIVAALEHVTVAGPQGRVVMDAKTHHASVNTYLSRCNFDGTFSIIQSFGQISPVIPKRYNQAFLSAQMAQLNPVEKSCRFTAASTDNDQTNTSIATSHFRTTGLLSVADIAIIATDEEGCIIRTNRCANQLFGYTDKEMLGMSVHNLLPPHLRGRHKEYVQQFADSPKNDILMGERGEVCGYKKDGSLFPLRASISKAYDDGKVAFVVTLQDITEQKENEETLIWRSMHDTLTTLPNRSLMQDRLTNALNRAKRDGSLIALLFIDLDNFKLVNDSYGHDIGDQLLIKIANQLLEVVRPGDTVARFGGDEFIVLCDQLTTEDDMYGLAQRINNQLSKPIFIGDINIITSVSIGIAFNHSDLTAEELLRNADSALYESKDRGRDSWHVYDQTIHEKTIKKLSYTNKLSRAIENKEFQVRFQPIVSADTGHMVGVETLIRWFSQEQEISPVEFIPIAEMSGVILPIGEWVFEQACIAENTWNGQLEGDRSIYVSVNVSPRQLSDNAIAKKFNDILIKTGASPDNIVLEITETALMDDVDNKLDILNELAELGLTIAIDDFGTGYSSLSLLMHMPVSILKIDRVFIDGIDISKQSSSIVSAVLSMAKALDLNVVAEGVERKEEYELLKKMHCNMIQGYYFSKPVRYAEIDGFINNTLKK
ncbi:ABC transporter substrate-binding protein [Colwelliaceae bacterium 6471]